MKRFLLSLTTAVVLLTGVNFADAAKSNDNFTIRFRENTLVVIADGMEEARLYTLNGKMIQKERGTRVEFELEQPGSYRLYAKVNGEMIRRRIELR